VTGVILSKSSEGTSAVVVSGVNWPPELSLHSMWMLSPGARVSAGAMELAQPWW
jgi:hypothetical protein